MERFGDEIGLLLLLLLSGLFSSSGSFLVPSERILRDSGEFFLPLALRVEL